MRGADFRLSPDLASIVASHADSSLIRRQHIEAILRVTSVGDAVGVPANASRALVDAVKAAGRRPVFVAIDEWGVPTGASMPDVVWIQAIAGCIGTTDALGGHTILVDAPETAALRSIDRAITDRLVTGCSADSLAPGIIDRQRNRCDEVALGLSSAAGLPVMSARPSEALGILSAGVVVRLPQACDASTFAAYGEAELTGLRQLARHRPLHPQARRHLPPMALAQTVANLERLLVVAVGPEFTDEEIDHAVLGVAKAAEYTGWRWCTDPTHAVAYEAEMTRRYGTSHEAYRPAFAV